MVTNTKELPTKKADQKTSQIAEVKKQNPAITIDSKLTKLARLSELAERRETVLSAVQNLKEFYISPDGNGVNLRLQDSKGKTFAIAHPYVIAEIVSMCKSKLVAEVEKIESQIDFTLP